MPDAAPLPPALVAVMRLALVFRREFAATMATEPWAAAVDAAPPMYGILRAVAHRPGSSQRTLAEVVMLDPSDLVPVLDRMTSNGWITRDRDPDDRRRLLVHLTPAGHEALTRYDAVAERVAERLLAGLTSAERDEFARLTFRALSSLDQPPAALPAPEVAADRT